MVIEIKSCRFCPFIKTENTFGEVAWKCSQGAFGLSTTPPEKDVVHICCPLLKEDIVIKHKVTEEGLTKVKYESLKKEHEEACHNNDYSKMIMMGSVVDNKMKKYKQDNICISNRYFSQCNQPDVGTDGGGDYCKLCGKRW